MNTENNSTPTHEQIERRAYQIYLEHGFHAGNDLADWLAAERELIELTESPGRTNTNTPPSMANKWKHATA